MRALMAYLGDCGVPVYLSDAVPYATSFPYITLDVSLPRSPEHRGSLALTLWTAGASANITRLFLYTTLADYFPARGTRFPLEEGLAVIRAGGPIGCVHAGEALGLSMQLDVRFFPSA